MTIGVTTCDEGILLPHKGLLIILARPMSDNNTKVEPKSETSPAESEVKSLDDVLKKRPKEIGGPAGPEPTRYGDWERKGRCIDF
ncbi:hypothetical protein ATO7_08102 [Oceanococcus atlanticus]|uniref:DUF1674 domain-containing protein n=1 Tax=Oceanococcus atlanticus TaxID=1317117 RepID=A0A1Y1SDB0_9GAMM|nr:succinate dehydrogenase assembly factor 4 [Oceanococcus atlanticus]ORE86986.1 hypothetical protein ATO7_08102 [Oceanococcus atlanticus]